MASFTSFLNLLKKNPATDGKDTFNIETMLNENWDKIDLKVEENSSAIGQIAVQKDETKTTNFNPDGSITEVTLEGGATVRTKVTTFPSATQIIETTVENGITTVKTITFNPDGTITEGVV